MTAMNKRLGAALGALAMMIGAGPGTVIPAGAYETGQLLIRDKGRAIVVKMQSGDGSILAASDANGEVRLTGLTPGNYSVRVVEGAQQTPIRVGPDGRMAFVAWQETKGPDPEATDPRARRALPVVRRWAEQIAFEGGQSSGFALVAGEAGWPPCPKGWICSFDTTLIAGATAPQLSKSTGIPSETAAIIIAEQARSGPFEGVIAFARRICPQTSVDFQDASIRFGDQTMLVQRGGDPKSAGFKCARGTGDLELFGKKHNYVGHVTLLK